VDDQGALHNRKKRRKRRKYEKENLGIPKMILVLSPLAFISTKNAN